MKQKSTSAALQELKNKKQGKVEAKRTELFESAMDEEEEEIQEIQTKSTKKRKQRPTEEEDSEDEDRDEEIEEDVSQRKLTDMFQSQAERQKKMNKILGELETPTKKQKTKEEDVSMEAPIAVSVVAPPQMPPIPVFKSAPPMTKAPQATLQQGTLSMYWFDACEVNGKIYLFGKALFDNKKHESVCVEVQNCQRNIFLYPRDPSAEEKTFVQEVNRLCAAQNSQIAKLKKFKVVRRNYCFEETVPHGESTYGKLVYPATLPPLTLDENNEVFAHMFGARTSPLETFLMKRKLKGPCWITIANVKRMETNVSWAKDAFTVDDPKSVKVNPNQAAAPALSVLSLKVKTFLNEQKQVNEIVMISGVVHSAVNVEGPTEEMKFEKFTAIRKIESGQVLPKVSSVDICDNEYALLNYFTSKLHLIDPDVIVGHNFMSYDLDVLLHRMNDHKIGMWSKLGRLHRDKRPKLQSGPGGMGESTYEERQVMSGRLVCDTYLSAREYLREKSYSLANLAASQLDVQDKPEIEHDLHALRPYFTSEEALGFLAGHNESDCYLTLRLMFKLSLLPLTKELTNVAGNLWTRTLTGSRAERIEYLLLHEFYDRNYIVPDKSLEKKEFSNKKKAAYSGGLVFEPQRGLYETYVLLLDFNSLYPSIIMEHHICFTTVDRPKNKQDESQVPDKNHPMYEKAVLPSIISTLIQKRREVKKLMKGQKDEGKLWQLDIKQRALKLTANSTYGCLGFSNSRFYCQPIAELITRQGRFILTQTKSEIETKLNRQVIYGDTDSVMVLTPFTDFKQGWAVGEEIQQHINKKHKHLEIGIEGLFRRILLLRKKKYVAILHTADGTQPNGYATKIEKKGIDMVRRDWCELSRNASEFCVDQILSGKSSEQVVESIHEHLKQLGDEVRQDKIELAKYILTKGLTKLPEEYPDARVHPHVQVAIRMRNKGLPVKVGERIPYVICMDSQTSKTVAERAYHPDEYKDSQGTSLALRLDWEWYLSQQVYPPLLRLCEHLQGTDGPILAECLGLDKRQFSGYHSSSLDQEYKILSDTIFSEDNEDKYKNLNIPSFVCPSCKANVELSIGARMQQVLKEGSADECRLLVCNHCDASISLDRILNYVQKRIRTDLQRYYLSNMSLSQQKNKSRILSMKVDHAISNGQVVKAHAEFSSQDMHIHLQYYKHLFDWRGAVEKLRKSNDKVVGLKCPEREQLKMLCSKVEHYLNRCGRSHVSLDSLFKDLSAN